MIHEILVDRVGGTTVISCRALDFYNLELAGEVTTKDIKSTIFRQLHITPEDVRGDFDIEITDNRPVEKNFNEVRAEESKRQKPKDPRI